jgi:hypothetical protein
MFIGHFAAGMAAKRFQPSISLATLFLAAQWLDLLWPTLLLLDIEHVTIAPGISRVTPLDFHDYPITHSLALVVGWSLLFGVVYFLLTRHRSGSLVVGLLVLSHWVLDLLVHIPDLPLYPGASPKVGLGLWNSLPLTILLEGAIFISGVWLYWQAKKSAGEKVNAWFWSLMGFLVVVHIMNLAGPPPPSIEAIAWAGHLQWLFVLWAWKADRK